MVYLKNGWAVACCAATWLTPTFANGHASTPCAAEDGHGVHGHLVSGRLVQNLSQCAQ